MRYSSQTNTKFNQDKIVRVVIKRNLLLIITKIKHFIDKNKITECLKIQRERNGATASVRIEVN